MKMKIKYLTVFLFSLSFAAIAQIDNSKQVGLEKAVKRIVQLSQFLGSMHADKAEQIADNAEYYTSVSFTDTEKRINELNDVRDTTEELMNRILTTDASSIDLITDIDVRLDTAYLIGEEIFYGVTLPSVLATIETIDALPDLLIFSAKALEVVSEETDKVLDAVPNIYKNIGRPQIYQEVMNTLHNHFRESTTTPDGGGFNESSNDATPI
ncbi:MAG: hypothetical protein ACJZ86_01685 [Pontiellaceae bacterium]